MRRASERESQKQEKRKKVRIIAQYSPDPELSEHSLEEGGISQKITKGPLLRLLFLQLLVRACFMTFIELQLAYQQLNVDDVISRCDGVQVIHPKEESHFSG
jgi:hypothetical protein